jgi:hypothetical protein
MLNLRWIEDKEGCLLANWYDNEKGEHGGFAETVVPMGELIVLRDEGPGLLHELDADASDQDEDDEEPAPACLRFASGGRW